MSLPAADEGKLLGELKDWETKGTHLCMNSPIDPTLLQLVQQELKSLQDDVKSMSVELEDEKRKVQHELKSVATTLEDMEQRVQMLETGQQTLEHRSVLFEDRMDNFEGAVNQRIQKLESSKQSTEDKVHHLQGVVNQRIEILESIKQSTEDKVHHLQGAVNQRMEKLERSKQSTEDKVHHLQEQVEDLASSRKSDETTSCQDNPMSTACPEKLVELIKRDYKGAVLCPFPWCEDELQLELSNVFTRLKIISKKKERALLTEDIVQMAEVFKPLAECGKPRVGLIEGQPGMGKTTYCQKLAYDWSVAGIPPEASFPKVEMLLLLKCRDMKNADIEEAINDQLLPQDADEKEKENFFQFVRCNQPRILLVLDGLDELPDDLFQGFLPLIRGRVFPMTYLLFTARHEAGMKVRRYCDTLFEIVGYTDEDADSYITKYFASHEDPNLANKVIGRLKSDRQLRELTTNPLNTAMLCLLFEDAKGVLPSNRTKLYDELVSCALRRYFAKKGVPLDTRDPVKTCSDQLNQLGKVALEALKDDRMHFSENEVKCQSIDFLRLCFLSREASASKLRPMPCYAFTHKTFQEYFAAHHLAHQLLTGDKEQADALLPQLTPVFKYWHVWEFLLTMVASKSDGTAAMVISCFCAALCRREAELEDEQDSDSDDDGDYEVHDDYDFNICEDTLDDFPILLLFTAAEETLINLLNEVFGLILASSGGTNELGDCQKKMVRALAECFPIHKLCTVHSNPRILSEYLKSNHSLTHLRWDDALDESALATIEHVLQSNCPLKYLDLRGLGDKCLGISGLRVLARALNANCSLTYLNLSNSSFGDAGATCLSQVLRSKDTLTHLNLNFTWICNSGAKELSGALQSNRSLTHLNLQANLIGNPGAEDFARALQSSCALMYLDLSNNRVGDSGAQALAKALESNRSLTFLDLGHTQNADEVTTMALRIPRFLELLRGRDLKAFQIGDSGAAAIAQALRSNCVLTRLNLQNNRISDLGATAIGEALQSNCTLTHLQLRGNRICDVGASHLAHAIRVNRRLVNLDLRNNAIIMPGGATGAALSQALQCNSVLTHLDLRCNFGAHQAAMALAESLPSNCTLTHVDLSTSMISSCGAVALAKALQLNRTLSHLDLKCNRIGDLGATEFVETLQCNTTLIFLDLRYNRIGESGGKKLHGLLRGKILGSNRKLLYHWSENCDP